MNPLTTPSRPVRLMILDPGHFHAALVLNTMYPQVAPLVHVFAPDGPELQDFLSRVEGFNRRTENPTSWQLEVHRGPDFLQRMVEEKPGNVMVTAGNNRRKTEYVKAAVEAGIHVLADKPLCIDGRGAESLNAAFVAAQRNDVLLYDIMTERHEIATLLQRALVNLQALFGTLQKGSSDNPSVIKESVHHLCKSVSGKPLRRPAWYFDVSQQGEGIVDVSTHLVDLVMWECFPDQPISIQTDVQMLKARRWPTPLNRDQFEKVTGSPTFPDFLHDKLDQNGLLPYYCNGVMTYCVRGIHAKVSVIWNFEAPPGGGDTHYSIIKGTKASVVIEQGPDQGFRPALFVEPGRDVSLEALGERLTAALQELNLVYPGLQAEKSSGRWQVLIPDTYHVGHEAHFGQVAEKFLQYLSQSSLPSWEVPNMIAKYFTTTRALELARENAY
ncbi:MAG: putative oxidoreductase C-terminal domain-containing protein [Acidobacteriota bacterium]